MQKLALWLRRVLSRYERLSGKYLKNNDNANASDSEVGSESQDSMHLASLCEPGSAPRITLCLDQW